MKYILMMTGTRAGVDSYRSWSEGDIQAHFAFLHALNKELSESGELVDEQPLTPPEQAKVVRARSDGAPITDGVFPESKEFLLGYWIVDVESAERAYEIASRLSAGPGPGGMRLNMPIEVRQFMNKKASPETPFSA
ncbi:MAG: hypothetical protein JO159_03015 [Acidobacteria bacterium]|nr:hypothetical protein [Acidobacteriota bacterium]